MREPVPFLRIVASFPSLFHESRTKIKEFIACNGMVSIGIAKNSVNVLGKCLLRSFSDNLLN